MNREPSRVTLGSRGDDRARSRFEVFVKYCCPFCKGPLELLLQAYRCATCNKNYPVVLDIPDFRVFPDPYIGYPEDWEKGHRLAVRYPETSFQELVEYYWSLTPEVSPDLVARYVRHSLAGVGRGRRLLSSLEREQPELATRPGRVALELGCRSGGLLVAASRDFPRLVGIDIAFRWLVIARKRLEEAGVIAQLVCGCAQHLPFSDQSFDLIVAENVLEHTTQPQKLIDEAYRALRPRGAFLAVTSNRYSLAPEPHVRVWGVGFLPRRYMAAYVRWRRAVRYEHVRLLGLFELKRLLERVPFRSWRLTLPTFSGEELASLSPIERSLVGFYHRIKDWPLFRSMLLLIAPLIQCLGVRDLPAEELPDG